MVIERNVTINGPIGTIAWSVPLGGELTYGTIYFRLNNIASAVINVVIETAPNESFGGEWAFLNQLNKEVSGGALNVFVISETNYGALRVQLRSPFPDGVDLTVIGIFHQPFKK